MRAIAVLILLCCLGLLAGGCSPAVQGSYALTRGDHAQALAHFNEALARNPDSAYLMTRIGQVHFDKADYSKAEEAFLSALAKDPTYPDAQLYLGLSRIGKGEREAGFDTLDAYRTPFKFFHQKFVREEAQRLRKHPEMSAREIIRSILDAQAAGEVEQKREERDINNF